MTYYPVRKEVKIVAATIIKSAIFILFKTRDIFYKAGQGSSNILRKIIYCQKEKNNSILQQGLNQQYVISIAHYSSPATDTLGLVISYQLYYI